MDIPGTGRNRYHSAFGNAWMGDGRRSTRSVFIDVQGINGRRASQKSLSRISRGQTRLFTAGAAGLRSTVAGCTALIWRRFDRLGIQESLHARRLTFPVFHLDSLWTS